MRQKTFGAFLFLFYVFCIDRGKRGARLRFTKEGAEVINFCFFKLAFAFLFFPAERLCVLFYGLLCFYGVGSQLYGFCIHTFNFIFNFGQPCAHKKQARIFKAGPVFI